MQTPESYLFEEALNKLNAAQKEAVQQIDGPVMVIAGPGTGKTQILSTRIGYILQSAEAQAFPENILCLTYTDAGAIAMRKRLVSMMGSEAYKLTIETFHAFCNRVIGEYPWHFSKKELRQADDLEKAEIMRKLIDQLEAGNPLKRYFGDAYRDIDKLLSFFSNMKKEGWNSAYMEERTLAWEQEILTADEATREADPYIGSFYYKRADSRTGAKKGDLKKEFGKLQEKFDQTRAAAALYHQYNHIMKEEGLYDYDDMILWVVDAFSDEHKKDLLASYQERYQYILVDEFQDTSNTQNQLVMRLAASYFTQNPNLFVVGDDDQSIYRFQGANLKNLTEYVDVFQKHIKLVVLEENYRSNQPILDASRALISLNSERISNVLKGITKHLKAANTERQSEQNQPEIWTWDHPVKEQVGIALEVQNLINSGVNPSEIALIYRKHAVADAYTTLFRHFNIPFTLRKAVNILDEPFTRQFFELLTYLEAEFRKPLSADLQLYRLLHLPFFEINAPIELAKLFALGHDRGGDASYREILDRFRKKPGYPFESGDPRIDKLIKLGGKLESWIPKQVQMTLQDFLATIMHESQILAWILRSPERQFLLDQLNAIFDFLKSESLKNPSISLTQFLEKIHLMEQQGIPISVVQVNQEKESVLLTTVHSAKGLEFDYVFMINCSTAWERKGNNYDFALPGNLTLHADKQAENPKELEDQENRRLFYVGMTRARKKLVISYPNADETGKELMPSKYVEDLIGATDLQPQEKTLEETQLLQGMGWLMSMAPEPEIPLPDHELLDRILENYRLSPTHLNTYLKCPITFYFNNVLRIPQARNAALSFGSALHGALDRFFKAAQKNGTTFPSADELVEMFHKELYLLRDSFLPAEYLRKLEYGEKVLKGWLAHRLSDLNIDAQTEKSFSSSVYRDVPIKGQLDKIEGSGLKVSIVDYKSGRPKNAMKKMLRPGEKDNKDTEFEFKFGGDYWRQAVFYKIILNQDPFWSQKVVDHILFDLVEPDDNDTYVTLPVQVTSEDESFVGQQMLDAYGAIMRHEFSKGCGKEDCDWCNFTKLHGLEL